MKLNYLLNEEGEYALQNFKIDTTTSKSGTPIAFVHATFADGTPVSLPVITVKTAQNAEIAFARALTNAGIKEIPDVMVDGAIDPVATLISAFAALPSATAVLKKNVVTTTTLEKGKPVETKVEFMNVTFK